jgi:hypothetical protein
MGDIITTSVSTIQTFTSTLTTNNLRVGTVSSLSFVSFPGLQQGYAQTVIAEQSTGTGLQELLVFRGSSASDRIRMQTTGSIVFEPGVGARTFPAVGSNVTPAMIINASSNVGIGIAAPTTILDVAGTGRFQILSTQQLFVSTISSGSVFGRFFGDGSQLTGLAAGGLSALPPFLSTNTLSTNLLTASNISTNSISTNNLTVSNIYGTGLTILPSLSVNTISTNTINGNLGRFTDISTNTISTNIVTGSVVGRLPANTLAASVSPLAVVNGNAYLSFSPQIEFQYNSGGYKHFMGSRHQGDTANSFGNAVDFWLYSATTGGSNASTTPGTCNVNTMSVTAQGVGIFNNSPSIALDVTGAGRFTGISTTTISTNTILANNMSTYSIAAENGSFSTFGSYYSFSDEAHAVQSYTQQAFMSTLNVGSIQIGDTTGFITMGDIITNSISTTTISTGTLTVGGTLYGRLPILRNNNNLTGPASVIISTPNTSYFYADYTNLTNYITISNYGAQNGDFINIVNTGNSGTPATFQVLDGSVNASTIIRYIYPGHAGVVAYSSSQWWPL